MLDSNTPLIYYNLMFLILFWARIDFNRGSCFLAIEWGFLRSPKLAQLNLALAEDQTVVSAIFLRFLSLTVSALNSCRPVTVVNSGLICIWRDYSSCGKSRFNLHVSSSSYLGASFKCNLNFDFIFLPVLGLAVPIYGVTTPYI